MKKIAKFSAILLGVCFGACFMLTGCNGNEHTDHVDEDGDGYCDICEEEMPSTEMALTDGIFDGSIETNPGYIRFHEEGELVEGKAIFYCLFGSENAGTQGAGFYTVEEKDYDYSGSYPSKDDLNEQTNAYPEGSVAQYTITLTSFDGETTYGSFGYEDGALYNFNAEGVALGVASYQGYRFVQQADNGKEEYGVALYKFTNLEDEDRTFQILHNGSYVDDVSAAYIVNGTWTASGSTYTLTPDDPMDKGGTFVLNEDGVSGTLTVDGTKFDLGQPVDEREVLMTFAGTKEDVELAPGFTGDGTFTATLYADDEKSMELTLTAMGATSVFAGTYTVNDDGEPVSFTASEAQAGNISGTIANDADGEGYTLTVDFSKSNASFWGEVTLAGEAAQQDVYVTFASEEPFEFTLMGMNATATVEATLMGDLTMELTETVTLELQSGPMVTPTTYTGTYTLNAQGIPAAFTVSTMVLDQQSGQQVESKIEGTFSASGDGLTLHFTDANQNSLTIPGEYRKTATAFIYTDNSSIELAPGYSVPAEKQAVLFDDGTMVLTVSMTVQGNPSITVVTGTYTTGANTFPDAFTVVYEDATAEGTVTTDFASGTSTMKVTLPGVLATSLGELTLTFTFPTGA